MFAFSLSCIWYQSFACRQKKRYIFDDTLKIAVKYAISQSQHKCWRITVVQEKTMTCQCCTDWPYWDISTNEMQETSKRSLLKS